MIIKILLVVLAYLLGSIPVGYLLVKYTYTRGEDIRNVGSGGIGATNVTRRAGRTAGVVTYLLDVTKGAVAVLLMRLITHDDFLYVGLAAILAIIGHVFPIFLGFRGGKGVATGVGVYLALAPISVLSTMALWGLIVYLTRYVSLGSILATAAVPLWTLLYYGWLFPSSHVIEMLIIALVGCGVIVLTHHENIKRLLNGTENKIGKRIGPPVTENLSSGKF